MRLAQVMTLRFLGGDQAQSARDAVTLQHAADGRLAMALDAARAGLEDTGPNRDA